MNTRRPWALPLVPLYALALATKNALHRSPKKLQSPVISVGSLSAGGAGKTPVVIALTRLLRSHGWHVDILSRGYGREGRGIAQVDLHKPEAARLFGDEPVLLAQSTGIPVWVGANRFASGTAAERIAVPESRSVHLLDDGFQHRHLHRTLDIVLLTAEDLADALLPAGNRREPLSALRRADVVLIREEEREALEPKLAPKLAPRGLSLMQPNALLWSIHRHLHFPTPLGVLSAGLRPIAFCAIARPENFATMLVEAGCGILETVAFNDHRAFTAADIETVLKVARDLNASGFVTTEKDAVKLSPALRAQLENLGPLAVVALEADFVYPERVARELTARLSPNSPEDPT